jgi:Concanavalin A-like lectin/glucanases superfamily
MAASCLSSCLPGNLTRENYGQSGSGGGYGLTVTNLGKPRIDLYYTPTTYTPVIGSTSVSAAVWDGANLRIYLNGVLDGNTTTGNAPGSGTSSVKIGRNSGGSYFNGLIDEVRVSNAAVYTSNFTPQTHLTAGANTKALWKFDGQVATDSSANGNNRYVARWVRLLRRCSQR